MTALRQRFYDFPPFPARHIAVEQNSAGAELARKILCSFEAVRETHLPLISAAEAGQKPAVLLLITSPTIAMSLLSGGISGHLLAGTEREVVSGRARKPAKAATEWRTT